MTRLLATLALALAVTACGDDDGVDQVDHVSNLIEVGVDCRTLFDARQEIAPDNPRLPGLNDRLREIGCHSSSSERTDDP